MNREACDVTKDRTHIVMTAEEEVLARLIIDTLNLDFDIRHADAATALYKDGFGLDSIDILEVALAVSQRYGVKLRSDDENNSEIFKSLGSLTAYIEANRIK